MDVVARRNTQKDITQFAFVCGLFTSKSSSATNRTIPLKSIKDQLMLVLVGPRNFLTLAFSRALVLTVLLQQLMHETLAKLEVRHRVGIVYTVEAVGVDNANINAPPCQTGPPFEALPSDGITVPELIDGVHAALELIVVQNHPGHPLLLRAILAKNPLRRFG